MVVGVLPSPQAASGSLQHVMVMTDGFYQVRGNARGTGNSPHACGPLMDLYQQLLLMMTCVSKFTYDNAFTGIGEAEMVEAFAMGDDDGFKVTFHPIDGERRVSSIHSSCIVLEFDVKARGVAVHSQNLEEFALRTTLPVFQEGWPNMHPDVLLKDGDSSTPGTRADVLKEHGVVWAAAKKAKASAISSMV